MKIAITGATGFIGRLLVEKHLALGDDVHILTRRPKSGLGFGEKVNFHFGDLSDVEALRSLVENTDVLYHCAAEIREESLMKAVNVTGTENLIKQASGNVKHWVQLSSVGVYGPIFSGTVTENQPYNPVNEYEITKLESDLRVIDASNSGAFTYTIVRPSNVIGSSMRNASLFALMHSIEKGIYFYIGQKGASANYVAVENVIEALYLSGMHPKAKNHIFNISDWYTLEAFIGNIAEKLQKPTPKLRFPKALMLFAAKILSIVPNNPLTVSRVKALSGRAVYPNTKIERELGYHTVVTVDQAIQNLTAFYKNKQHV
ncbi:NAD dependent epimerase/dehydratase [Flavobacterium noncentrifugens]|uniref:Nucleoside-diphosphate-sugar epimerase n=1 Tax=Flavobacterium noncentrifugens TaxID=1128970 RepID=A0A1G8V7X6_9FLAO|nr:NAD-dependent epimerase/dehydratase family protein [Flavobacterium noncentrifugens]GEP50382.1 NAD dependent epimerase/dehydratase [Flavobacterium noncentrifugens]SDJ62188.1 Nucleoside-diphosphate-sugar epimerase [Flavobacterium noncentrifugens]